MTFIEQPVDDLEHAKSVVEAAMADAGHTADTGWHSFRHPDGSVLYTLDCVMCHQHGSVTNFLTMSAPMARCKNV